MGGGGRGGEGKEGGMGEEGEGPHTHSQQFCFVLLSVFFLVFDLWSSLLKIYVRKSLSHRCDRCFFDQVSVTWWTRLACGAAVYITSPVNPFLFVIGKEQTNMAVL